VNRGLLLKSLHEAAATTVILSSALLLVEGVLAYALPALWTEFSDLLLKAEFFRKIITAMLGTDVGDLLDAEAFSAIAAVHPVVLAITWTHAIVLCTRVPAGEIDRGTIDVLFGLPVSRWRVYLSETLMLLASGAVLVAMGLVGHRLGIIAGASAHKPALGRMVVVTVNLWCLYLAVGGLACLVSAFSERRGRAVATVFGILLASFLLNFLAQFWPPAERVSFLSVLHYYKPLGVLRPGVVDAGWPVADMLVLGAFAVVTWTAGGLWFARRDICTV
jgi:ABC-2 type transport system permease protein